MKNTRLLRSFIALSVSALLLAGCGGGGGGGGGDAAAVDPPPSTRFGASSQYAGTCDLATQKKFVRSYMDEAYLWYSEIPEVDANAYGNIPDYFNALLVRTPDVNGVPKDRFSAVLPLAQASNVLQRSQAVQQDATPTLVKAHTSFVPVTKLVTVGSNRVVGYIQFNDHDVGAQDDLIASFRQLRDQGVQDLVLDLRFNSGGFLYIALSTASMITGPASQGKVFETLRYNDKRSARTAQSTMLYSSTVQFGETQNPVGSPLPQLSLPRVFILTSGQTCSASESIINSLRGIDVQVIRIGSTTCGKPYGFSQKNNCEWAFFPIEFQGFNAKGFGDYTTGFTPTCQVQDNTSVAAGSDSDPLLNAARYYIDNGACPSGTATGVQSAATPRVSSEQPSRPAWAGRLLLPQQR
jgi:hypothetical protein